MDSTQGQNLWIYLKLGLTPIFQHDYYPVNF